MLSWKPPSEPGWLFSEVRMQLPEYSDHGLIVVKLRIAAHIYCSAAKCSCAHWPLIIEPAPTPSLTTVSVYT